MPWSATGTYSALAAATSAFAGKVLTSADWNAVFTDIATGISRPNGMYSLPSAAVNMNSVADTSFTVTLPAGFTRYRVQNIVIYNASVDLTAATTVQYALFTAAGGGGTTIVAATATTVSSTAASTANNAQVITPVNIMSLTGATLFFRVTTAHGSAATASVSITIQPLL